MSGRIEEGVLPNLLQYLSLSHATGCLMLRHPQNLHANIYVDGGRVVFVDAKPLYDLAALAALLRWSDGRFAFRPGVRSPRNTLTSSTETLLLQATQKADEISGASSDSVDADSVLKPLEPPSGPAGVGGGARLTRGRVPGGSHAEAGASDRAPLNNASLNGASLKGAPLNSAALGASVFGRGGAWGRGDAYEFGPVTALGDPLAAPGEKRPGPSGGLATGAADTVSLSLAALDLWRRLDGNSSLRDLAAATGRQVGGLVEAARELLDNGLVDYVSLVVADPRFAQELAREAVDLLGPVGEIVVEDALYELGLSVDTIPVGKVDELVELLEIAFDNAFSRAEFHRRVRELRRLFALEAPVPGGD